MSPKLTDKAIKFSENERILCYQGPLIYEAKCLKAEIQSDGKPRYFVHYNGWNKHWDEWVTESRVLKYNETNLNKQKETLKHFSKDKSRKSKTVKAATIKVEKEVASVEKKKVPLETSTTNQAVSVVSEPKRKRSRVSSIEEPQEVCSRPLQDFVKLPDELKPILVDDWDFVTRQKMLFHLPAKVTVDAILKKYMEEKSKAQTVDNEELKEMVSGLKEYFNVLLGTQLLYKFERPQYGDIIEKHPNRTVSHLYGAPHFIRFFIRMRAVLAVDTGLSPKSLKTLLHWVNDVLSYMKNHISCLYDVNEYQTAPADYHRKAIT